MEPIPIRAHDLPQLPHLRTGDAVLDVSKNLCLTLRGSNNVAFEIVDSQRFVLSNLRDVGKIVALANGDQGARRQLLEALARADSEALTAKPLRRNQAGAGESKSVATYRAAGASAAAAAAAPQAAAAGKIESRFVVTNRLSEAVPHLGRIPVRTIAQEGPGLSAVERRLRNLILFSAGNLPLIALVGLILNAVSDTATGSRERSDSAPPLPEVPGDGETIQYALGSGHDQYAVGAVGVIEGRSATAGSDALPDLARDSGADDEADGRDGFTVAGGSAVHGTVHIGSGGKIVYQPNPGYQGPDTIQYIAAHSEGSITLGSFAVDVVRLNSAPVVTEAFATIAEDGGIATFDVLANVRDVDGDPLSVVAASAANGTVWINIDGSIAYTPNPDFNGTDAIQYTVSDGRGGLATGTLTLTVSPVNDAPVVAPANAATDEDTPVTIDVLAYASDVDGDTLSLIAASAARGSVAINPDGTITYTPDPDFNGADTVQYTVSDGRGGAATGTLAVNVAAVNDAPVVTPAFATVAEDSGASLFSLLGNVQDPEGDLAIVTAVSAANGTVVLNLGGIVAYTPNPNFNGTDTIQYTVTDINGATSQGTLTIDVTPVNDAPVAAPVSASTPEDTPITLDALTAASDIDGDTLAVINASAARGTVTINADNTLTYRPDLNYFGSDTISYTVSDGQGATTVGQIAVGVSAVNDAPTARDAVLFINTNVETNNINVLANVTDVEGNSLALVSATAELGTVTVRSNGRLNYMPNSDTGPQLDTIHYVARDSAGGLVDGYLTVLDGANQFNRRVAGNQSDNTINGNNNKDVLAGLEGNDTLSGRNGDDWLIGGRGADTLTGGAGADRFLVRAHDIGTGRDTIKDFNKSQGDVLDISEVLSGTPDAGNIQDYVKLFETGGDTIVQIDPGGGGAFNTDVFVLERVTGLSLSELFNNQNLVV